VVKPLTGVCNDGPSDACVLKPIGTKGVRGIVLSNGINPEYGKLDAYNMAVSVIDEAIRNAVAVGADPEHIALLDNFCWGDPLRPETLGSLVEACRGCYEAAVHYGTPFISGKDSLNNEYLGSDGQRHAIPPSLLISAIGLIDDVNQTVTMDLKEAGNQVYLVGEFQPAVGGAYLNQLLNSKFEFRNSCIPGMPRSAPALYRTLHAAMSAGLVRACHDLSEGGVAVAAAEMCIGGRAGLSADLPTDDPVITLFGETNGCFLIEVRECDRVAFEDLLAGAPFQRIGIVTHDPTLTLSTNSETRITIPVSSLVSAWNPQSSQ
jgi:phosphoribosylformylglycinamidine (FGAM) synthase-like enzyme